MYNEFLSTPSARRATILQAVRARMEQISIHALREEGDQNAESTVQGLTNFYPRPPRGGRRDYRLVKLAKFDISIHALREEGDHWPGAKDPHYGEISIHALREEGDPRLYRNTAYAGNFYPRPPRGGRHGTSTPRASCIIFLSTPSARRATTTIRNLTAEIKFLSTPSARRATKT